MPRRFARPQARPNMRFVPAKTVERQSTLSLHRVRQTRLDFGKAAEAFLGFQEDVQFANH